MALNLGLNLQTNRTVASVETASSGKWKVITHNKEVTTPKVIHATNGYSSYLLPEMTGRIVPLKGHVAAIPPSIKFESKPLDKTMAVIWDSDYDYLIQRQAKGKHVILGGGDLEHPEGLIGPLGDSDDSVMNDEIATALKEFPEAQFEGWSQPADRTVQDRTPQEVLETVVWTGIMGISKDCLPFLGELPGKEGQYIAAGYHGHGMRDPMSWQLLLTSD
jgi:glycine/D-amino acid oxidase-like deaminating enzyme